MLVSQEIDPTGSRDVTVELATFLNSAPDGSRVDFPDAARFRLDGTVTLNAKSGLDIRGHGSLLFADDIGVGNRSQLVLNGGGTYTITDLDIRGANPAASVLGGDVDATRQGQHCLRLNGVAGLCLVSSELAYSFGDTLYLGTQKTGPSKGGAKSYTWTSDVWVRGCYLHNAGRHGITLLGGRGIVIAENIIDMTHRSIIDMEPNAAAFQGCDDIHVVKNHIGLSGLNFLANHGSGPCNNVHIEDNVMTRSLNITVWDMLGSRRSNWSVLRNTTEGRVGNDAGGVMYFENVDGVEVAGNTQSCEPLRHMALVKTVGCTAVSVHDNVVTDGVELQVAA